MKEYKLKPNWKELMTTDDEDRAGSIPDIISELSQLMLPVENAVFTGTLDNDFDLEVHNTCAYIPHHVLTEI